MMPHIGRVHGLFGVYEPVVGKPHILVYDFVTDPTMPNKN